MKFLALLVMAAGLAASQTTINGGRTALGPIDFSGAASTKPIAATASAPATCVVSQYYFNTANGHTFACTSTNTWTQVDGGGGGTFSSITTGTNTLATMTVGTGASLVTTGSGVINATLLGGVALSGVLQSANNLSDLGSVSAARTNLGLGSFALLNNPMTTLGDLVYGGASGTPTRLAGNTTSTREFVTSTGSGGLAAAPTIGALVIGDIPSGYAYSSLSGAPTIEYQLVGNNGTSQTARNRLNLIPGTGITINSADNSGSNSTDVTISATGSSMLIPNDGSTGTTVNQLAKINTSGNAVNAGTSDTAVPVFIVVGGAGTTGSATLATGGTATCKTDAGGATIAHFLQASTTTAGTCHDAGATAPTSGWVIGQAQSTAAANSNTTVALSEGYNASVASALTAHTISGPLECVAASANTSAYTCTTSPSFTPATGDTILFKADVTNSGAATLNVNSTSAANIEKWGNTTPLAANDLQAGQWTLLTFDGTNWQMNGQLGASYPTAFGSWTQTVFTAGSTGNSTFGPLYLAPASSGTIMLSRSQPSTPYTIDYGVNMEIVGTSGSNFTFGWRESATSKVTEMFAGSSGFGCQNNTSNTTFSSNGCGTSGTFSGGATTQRTQYFRLQNTGSVLRVYISPDGLNWGQLGSDVNVNTFFTTAPDQLIIGGTSATSAFPLNSFSVFYQYVH